MPCPHFDVKIIQRSKRQSAVASAAYQSGERLFSEYDQKQKYYSHKSEIVYTEIMLPPHAPPEYADRNSLWNDAEAIEKQWNSQLARRFVLAIPRELPPEQYADLIRDYCREFFVSKGIQTNIGNLNRDIKAANSLMQSIRQMVRSLKGWLSGLKEKKAALLEALEQAKEPTIPELLSRYLDKRSEERTGWTSKGKLKGTVGDFNKVMEAERADEDARHGPGHIGRRRFLRRRFFLGQFFRNGNPSSDGTAELAGSGTVCAGPVSVLPGMDAALWQSAEEGL